MTTLKLRVANVNYLNAAPFQAIKRYHWIKYSEHSPTECARMLLEGECDLACIPIAEYFSHGGYQLLDYCIAADGPVESVFLFSQSPIEQLETILLDTSSQTSATLLRILLTTLYPQHFNEIYFKRHTPNKILSAIKDNTGALIIGDLAFQNKTHFKYCFDLAQLWKELTGLPFVFAVWALNKTIPQRNLDAISLVFGYGLKHREIYARSWADKNNYSRKDAVEYVSKNIVYALDHQLYRGARDFLERGWQQGIFPNVNLNFTSDKSTKKLPIISLDTLLDRAAQGQRISIDATLQLAINANINDLLLAVDRRRNHLSSSITPKEFTTFIPTNINDVAWKTSNEFVPSGSTIGFIKPISELLNEINLSLEQNHFKSLLLISGPTPELNLEYYLDLLTLIKKNHQINLIGLSAQEIQQLSQTSFLSIETTLNRLKLSGLDCLSSAGAEILIDNTRKHFNPSLCSSIEWLQTHRLAHEQGIKSFAELRYDSKDSWEDRIIHLQKLRRLQDETSGFTNFLLSLKTPSVEEDLLRLTAICFIFLDNIRTIQISHNSNIDPNIEKIIDNTLALFGLSIC